MTRDKTVLALAALLGVGIIVAWYYFSKSPAFHTADGMLASKSQQKTTTTDNSAGGQGQASGVQTQLPNSPAPAGLLDQYVPPKDSSGTIKRFAVYVWQGVPPYTTSIGEGVETRTDLPIVGAKVVLQNGQIGYTDKTGVALFPYADISYPQTAMEITVMAAGFKMVTALQAIPDASMTSCEVQLHSS